MNRLLDLGVQALEGLRLFQDRKPDRLRARAERKVARAKRLEARGKKRKANDLNTEAVLLFARAAELSGK